MIETYLALPTWAHLALAGVLGLIVGSFVNVVIVRLPPRLMHAWQMIAETHPDTDAPTPPGLIWPRSRCPQCEHTIAWHDNIPIVSWCLLQGRCRHCRGAIGWRYPIVELIAAVAAVVVVAQWGLGWPTLAALGLTWTLIAASAIDLEHHLLPDVLTLGLLWAGLLINATVGWFATPTDAIWGAAAGFGVLWLVLNGFALLTGKEGMGGGDLKLLAALGAWLGWSMLPFVLFVASALGTVVGVLGMVLAQRGRDTPIAFGPHLAFAGWLALIWHAPLSDWFLF